MCRSESRVETSTRTIADFLEGASFEAIAIGFFAVVFVRAMLHLKHVLCTSGAQNGVVARARGSDRRELATWSGCEVGRVEELALQLTTDSTLTMCRRET